MKLALWIFLVMSLAGTPQLACGEESVSAFSNDNSTDDEPIAEMETETHDDDDLDSDDELDDEAEEDEQKAASLFDQLYERGKKKGRKGKGSKGKKGKGKELWLRGLGCYKDAGPIAWQNSSYRALGRLYLSFRGRMKWNKNFFNYLVMECAKAAQPQGCKCFGVQFYGECWCSEKGCETFSKYGKSNNCVYGLGKDWTNYVYKSRCGSKYGCCKDDSTPALGKNYKGCPDCVTAVDLVIVVDASGSIGKKNFEKMKGIVIKLIRHFSVRRSYARIGIVRYSSSAQQIVSPQASQLKGFAALQKTIKKMRYTRGGTNTGLALQMAYRMLMKSRQQVKKFRKISKLDQVCIVLTDGLTNDKKRLKKASNTLKKIAKVIAVGVKGRNYSKASKKKQELELKMIATNKKKDFFLKDNFEMVKKVVDPIAKRACPLNYKKKGR